MKLYVETPNYVTAGGISLQINKIKLCDYSIYTYVCVLGDLIKNAKYDNVLDLIHAAQYMVHYDNLS